MFKFQYPWLLWALWAAPLTLLLAGAYRVWRAQAVDQLDGSHQMLPPQPGRLFWLKNTLLALALALLALAAANPQRGVRKQTRTQQAADVFLALDLSQSMLATDLKPSRLDWAKRFAQKLVHALEGERVGLLFFAGSAYVQVPLSTDYTFVLQSLQSADPGYISTQGTAIPTAIDLAEKSFEEQPGGGRALILITDGEDHDAGAVERAGAAFAEGTVIYTVGVGSVEGAPVPTTDGQYKRDEKGNIVITRLGEQALQEIALAGGGRAYQVTQDETALRALRREVDQLQKRDIAIRSFSEQESWYAWFALPALLLLLLRLYLERPYQDPLTRT